MSIEEGKEREGERDKDRDKVKKEKIKLKKELKLLRNREIPTEIKKKVHWEERKRQTGIKKEMVRDRQGQSQKKQTDRYIDSECVITNTHAQRTREIERGGREKDRKNEAATERDRERDRKRLREGVRQRERETYRKRWRERHRENERK